MPVTSHNVAPAHVPSPPAHGNVGRTERIASAVGGGLLALYGLSRRSAGGYALAGLGGALVARGVSGYCPAYGALGMSTAEGEAGALPVEVAQSVTVFRPREEVYAFWRRLENLPRFMHHLERVTELDEQRSRWEAKGPGPLPDVTWEAKVVEERPGEILAWRSLPGAGIENAGHVRFEDAPNGATEIHARIAYRPPAGPLGAAVARWLDPALGQMVRNDIHRFQNVLEAGEIPTTEGQPSGREKSPG